ncbi:hypothetical protein HETIRDRAFT_17257, partial [Heterobasidion irregulare TC 32-1]
IATSAGYHCRVARHKPFLSPAAVWKRLIWAKENMTRDWNEVIWTDEAKLELGERPGHKRPTFKSSRKSIMVWGYIAHGVKDQLIKLEFLPATMSEKGRRRGGGLGTKEYVAQVLEGPL